MVRRIALVAYTALLLTLLFLPSAPGPTSGYDKFGHVVAFAVFTYLFWWNTDFDGEIRIAFALSAGIALGLLTEAVQAGIPGRAAEWQDIVADVVGAFVGVMVGKVGEGLSLRDRAGR